MALGGDKLTGSTGGNSSTGNRPSRNDRNDSNPYSQYQEAMQEAGLNNMSGNTNATYGDGTTHGNNNPDGVGGLPDRNDNSSSGDGNGSSAPAPAPKPQKPKTLSASETLAKIAREEWEDWKKRFQPRIEDLARQASTGELTKGDINRADRSVTRSFDRSAANEARRTSRLGIQRGSRQQAASERMLGLNETATRASVRNNTRIAGQDRDMQILAGGGNIGLGANQ
jgi:hypothetical protein